MYEMPSASSSSSSNHYHHHHHHHASLYPSNQALPPQQQNHVFTLKLYSIQTKIIHQQIPGTVSIVQQEECQPPNPLICCKRPIDKHLSYFYAIPFMVFCTEVDFVWFDSSSYFDFHYCVQY